MAGAGDRAGGARQRRQSGEKLAQATQITEATGRVVGQPGASPRRSASGVKAAQPRSGGKVVLSGCVASWRAWCRACGSDAPDQSARLRRRHPCREKIAACLSRPLSYSGKQGRQAYRIRQIVKLQRRRTRSSSPTKSTISGPATRTCWLAAIETHQATLAARRICGGGCRLLLAKNEAAAKAKGGQGASASPTAPQEPERKNASKEAWFPQRPEWGPAARVASSVVKRRHGSSKPVTRGSRIKRWVGLGVIADNLVTSAASWPSNQPIIPIPLTSHTLPAGHLRWVRAPDSLNGRPENGFFCAGKVARRVD